LVSLVVLALCCTYPAVVVAGTSLFARLAFRPNNGLSALTNASIRIQTTNKKGANGVLITAKVKGARDLTNVPANLTMLAQTAWRDGTGCRGAAFEVPIVNGNGIAKATGTDVGLSEINLNPGRMLDLSCFNPFIYIDGGGGAVSFPADFELYNPLPGTILRASFALSPSASNPITSWRDAEIHVQNVMGDIVATTKITGAQEGAALSSRAIVVLFPILDTSLQCTETFFLDQSIALERGKGKSIRPNFDNGNIDPGGRCLDFFGLTDGNSHPISERFGVVQGTDND
jgi:hypothetical protein